MFASASDGAGGVYVSGWTEGNLGGPNAGAQDVLLAHYDGAGNQTWIRQFGTAGNDAATAAAPDGGGGVYLSGGTTGSLGGPHVGVQDAWLAHYDSAGNQSWLRQLGTPNFDGAAGAASDATGGVYVSGGTTGSLGGVNAGGEDVWLAHYDAPGNQLWIQQFGSNVGDTAYACAPDGTGYFLASLTLGNVPGAGGSQGNLCLGGAIGRFVGPGQVQNSGATGSFSLVVDLDLMPTPTGLVPVQAQETWHFQAWFRDMNPASTSNFTDTVGVLFF